MRSSYKESFRNRGKHEIKGGTYCVGGTTEMALNITYNYSDIINRKMEELGILKEDSYSYAYYLNGKTGAETIEPLKKIISSLKDDATEGNAKKSLVWTISVCTVKTRWYMERMLTTF